MYEIHRIMCFGGYKMIRFQQNLMELNENKTFTNEPLNLLSRSQTLQTFYRYMR